MSNGKKWVICMVVAFVPLIVLGVIIEFTGYSPHPWVLMPILVSGAVFSALAYAIRT